MAVDYLGKGPKVEAKTKDVREVEKDLAYYGFTLYVGELYAYIAVNRQENVAVMAHTLEGVRDAAKQWHYGDRDNQDLDYDKGIW